MYFHKNINLGQGLGKLFNLLTRLDEDFEKCVCPCLTCTIVRTEIQ